MTMTNSEEIFETISSIRNHLNELRELVNGNQSDERKMIMPNSNYKKMYAEARENAYAAGRIDRLSQNVGVYTTEMIAALRDMAEHDVYPDGTFGDDECNVWEMFHMIKGR